MVEGGPLSNKWGFWAGYGCVHCSFSSYLDKVDSNLTIHTVFLFEFLQIPLWTALSYLLLAPKVPSHPLSRCQTSACLARPHHRFKALIYVRWAALSG